MKTIADFTARKTFYEFQSEGIVCSNNTLNGFVKEVTPVTQKGQTSECPIPLWFVLFVSIYNNTDFRLTVSTL